ncbi:ribosome maturation factor RimP [Georgenia halophila]|uniref:Ribosome maturation factor RimP n=1 Tax=Georgenia halophila TaxID=620889 RepID=A0ABP8L749_9MICO
MSRARPTDLPDRLRGAVGPVVDAAGLLLEDVTVAAAGHRKTVRVVVDLPDGPGGVESDRLADVSRAISAVLDDADLIEGAHTLEVSTPGADRPLREPRHFRRAVGRKLRVSTAEGRELTGRLRDADERGIVIDVDGTAQDVPYERVGKARVEIELNRPEEA